MDALRAKLRYLNTAHDALQTDISVTKRATEKADVDMTQAQVDKEKQVRAAQTHTVYIVHLVTVMYVQCVRMYVCTYMVIVYSCAPVSKKTVVGIHMMASMLFYCAHTCSHTCTHLQDLYVDRLTEEVQRVEEQAALYKAQCAAQTQDSQAVKEALTEAAMELEVRTQEGWA